MPLVTSLKKTDVFLKYFMTFPCYTDGDYMTSEVKTELRTQVDSVVC